MSGLLGLVRLEIVGVTPTAGFLGVEVDATGMGGALKVRSFGKLAEVVLEGDSLWECLCLCLYLCLCVSPALWCLSWEPTDSIGSLVLLIELEAVMSIISALEKSSQSEDPAKPSVVYVDDLWVPRVPVEPPSSNLPPFLFLWLSWLWLWLATDSPVPLTAGVILLLLLLAQVLLLLLILLVAFSESGRSCFHFLTRDLAFSPTSPSHLRRLFTSLPMWVTCTWCISQAWTFVKNATSTCTSRMHKNYLCALGTCILNDVYMFPQETLLTAVASYPSLYLPMFFSNTWTCGLDMRQTKLSRDLLDTTTDIIPSNRFRRNIC